MSKNFIQFTSTTNANTLSGVQLVGYDPVTSTEIRTNIASILSGGGGMIGTVSPNGIVSAVPGVTYFNGANTTFWVKTSGSSTTGWLQLI